MINEWVVWNIICVIFMSKSCLCLGLNEPIWLVVNFKWFWLLWNIFSIICMVFLLSNSHFFKLSFSLSLNRGLLQIFGFGIDFCIFCIKSTWFKIWCDILSVVIMISRKFIWSYFVFQLNKFKWVVIFFLFVNFIIISICLILNLHSFLSTFLKEVVPSISFIVHLTIWFMVK